MIRLSFLVGFCLEVADELDWMGHH